MKRLAVAALACLAWACAASRDSTRVTPRDPVLPATLRVQVVERGARVVREVPLERYVESTVIAEFAPAAGDAATVRRMYEVQAIISRTYAVSHRRRHARDGFDLCSTTHCQIFDPARLETSRWADAAIAAVATTKGRVLRYAGQPVETIFHADCGGHTSRPVDVWRGGSERPYLIAQPDEAGSAAHAQWVFTSRVKDLAAALAGDPRTRVSGTLESIEVVARDASGRAGRIAISGRRAGNAAARTRVEVSGEDFRQVMSGVFGPRSIRSTRFEVSRRAEDFTFSGLGFGHGVGLCQAGALARLQSGRQPADVLRFYYPGTSIQ
jgi:stage II sporulation protein D